MNNTSSTTVRQKKIDQDMRKYLKDLYSGKEQRMIIDPYLLDRMHPRHLMHRPVCCPGALVCDTLNQFPISQETCCARGCKQCLSERIGHDEEQIH